VKKIIVALVSFGFVFAYADGNSVKLNSDRYIKNSSSLKRVQSSKNRYIELRSKKGSKQHGHNGGSVVKVNDNINVNLVNKSTLQHSTVGMKVRASGSEVTANKNSNINVSNKSQIERSVIGVTVKAE